MGSVPLPAVISPPSDPTTATGQSSMERGIVVAPSVVLAALYAARRPAVPLLLARVGLQWRRGAYRLAPPPRQRVSA